MFRVCMKQEIARTTREVNLNNGDPHKLYRANNTSTTKYNLATFLPKALFEQYRWAFIVIAIKLKQTSWYPANLDHPPFHSPPALPPPLQTSGEHLLHSRGWPVS